VAQVELEPPQAADSQLEPAPEAAALQAEVQSTFDYMPATLGGYAAGLAVVSFLFWKVVPAMLMGPWVAVFCVLLGLRLWAALRYARRPPSTEADWRAWMRVINLGTYASGVVWGVTVWLFYPLGESSQQIGLILVVYSFCVASVPVLARRPSVHMVFVMLCFVPMAVRIASDGSTHGLQLALVLLVILALTAVLARNYRQALQRVIEMKLRGDKLLAALRIEKKAADAARREAEVANRAKTQFFTAASHDLRQPLHAMGLFAEALRQKSQDGEVAHLVNSINESVDALEGLFSELLDITRIDSGGIDVNPQHFEIGDLLRKLRLHFEPTAFEKGLALRLRGASYVAFADPLLVERILRNLVSNAIRYTHDGSVLVSCRKRGDKLQLQVWDSGPGIRESEQVKIFEEFYQVPGTRPAAAHESKGLGLGLSIVKRLADLMHAPLALRSEVGRGTVFTLELPQGKAVRPSLSPVPGKLFAGLTLEGRRIVVVEDEPAVRSGLEALLRGWGATIDSFDSVATCRAWAAAADPVAMKPDLLIVDYRLEQGQSGVDAIAAMRRRFGSVPAIVVTGSTMTGHDREAQEQDFHLLIKPVVPNKLRAMIGFKLGVKAVSPVN
jgi:signal transduction histidine kinase